MTRPVEVKTCYLAFALNPSFNPSLVIAAADKKTVGCCGSKKHQWCLGPQTVLVLKIAVEHGLCACQWGTGKMEPTNLSFGP